MLDFSVTTGSSLTSAGPRGSWATQVLAPVAVNGVRDDQRRRSATVDSIRRILRPRSIVVIGASRNPGDVGSRIIEGLLIGAFTGELYVVHHEVTGVYGAHSITAIRELPEGVDLAIVCVDTDAVLKTVDECGQAGVHAAVVISSGFAESGPIGRLLQSALLDLTRGYGMRLVGPNCLGIVNMDAGVRLHAACSPILPTAGTISLAAQTGALGTTVLDFAAERELGLSSFVSLGNKADVSSNDLLEYWEVDPATRVMLLYLESFGNPWRFARIAQRVGASKPIVALKAARSEGGARSAGRHGVALADDDAVVRAIFEQTGVIQADRIDELFDIACCLDLQPLPRGRRVAIVTNAAGPGILAADACATARLEAAGEMTLVATPADYRAGVETVLCDPEVDSLVVICSPVEAQRSAEILESVGEAVQAARAHGISDKPVLVCAMTRRRRASPLAAGAERIPSYAFPESAIRALAKIVGYAEWRATTEERNKQ